jgi:hypothetical protein
MISHFSVTTLLLSVTLLFSSCAKNDLVDEGRAPGEAAVAKYLFDAARDEIDQQLNFQSVLNGFHENNIGGDRSGCATVSIFPVGQAFPKVVTIMFPKDCRTFAGAEIEGTVMVNISGRIRETGTQASFTLKDFKYKKYSLSGNYLVTFTGTNAHRTEITDGKVITPDTRIITYQATNTAVQTAGLNTTFKSHPATFLQDDEFVISTVSSGINSKGNKFEMNSETPLTWKFACQWITSGKMMIKEESRPVINALLDYGDGMCDNKAILTINNFVTTITLP